MMSAEQGFADAQCDLGLCYKAGNGVTKDEAKAVAMSLSLSLSLSLSISHTYTCMNTQILTY